MLNRFFTICALLFLFLIPAFGQTGWQVIGTLPSPSPDINSISVVNQNVIWVACLGGRAYLSTDGGVNWTLKNTGLPVTDLYGISAIDENNCWVGTLTGAIYHTSNGGTNWSQQIIVSGSFINGIHMFDLNNGVYTGDPTGNGVPYQNRYTTDGGTTWTLAPNSPIGTNEYGVINAWDWTDQNHFWVGSANIAANPTTAKIFYTTTGFAGTWNAVPVTGTGGSTGLYYQAIAFTDNNNGLAGSNNGDIVKTTNGGQTWSAAAPPTGVSLFASITMNGMKDGSNTIRLSLNDGTYRIFKTTNYGTVWTEEIIPVAVQAAGPQDLEFVDSNLGFAGCGGGKVLKYTGVVPVELTSFTANVNTNGQVTLNWNTASEINNMLFEIERKNEQGNYATIGYVDGYGTTTEAQQYTYVDKTVGTGTFFYRLKQIDFGGRFEYSGEVMVDIKAPLTFELGQNYPNPFNPSTTIKYSIAEAGQVKLTIFNMLGEEVNVLIDKQMETGIYEISFNASGLPSGTYIYKLESPGFVQVKKMILMK